VYQCCSNLGLVPILGLNLGLGLKIWLDDFYEGQDSP
jgi:hypothetical protein